MSEEIEEISLLERKIIRQIEYYFGNVNLPKDKFLKEKQQEDDGWITLECLTTFNRLKLLSTDLDEIKNALKKSKAGLLQIHEEELKVRRSPDRPVPDADDPVVKLNTKLKSLYMKGFPLTYSLDDVENFLNKLGVFTVFIRMRKDNEHKFKGSIFVELTTKEDAEKLVNDKELKCEDTPMVVMRREDYFTKKNEERASTRKPEKNDTNVKVEDVPYPNGAVLYIKGIGKETRREGIKSLFSNHEQVSWIDYNAGDGEGHIRFSNEGGAQKAVDGVKAENDGKILIEGEECEVKVLEGEEEENFWKMAREDDRNRMSHKNQRGRGFRDRRMKNNRRGGGKKGFAGRKRPWEDSRKNNEQDEKTPANEHKKFDSGDEASSEKKEKNNAPATTDNQKEQKEANKGDSEATDTKKQKVESAA